MSLIDELQRMHVLVAARGLMEANDVSNWVMTSDGKMTDHGKLFEAMRALDGGA